MMRIVVINVEINNKDGNHGNNVDIKVIIVGIK
jgi:hypothetical protein